ncbi:hypothetical protein K469DRAFT_688275 [Zopfia rhizophila CBS 207.26]|uniref:MARVEL domain-containing protein n=1 Tax=Zopfia rhizophila CBS 207.26 TaxID=1314779 RepID=A0A6A6E388_9PEZI|nr:hypothetical protein K469DRAFT_688275 [Zopfia rhizophila CBS 207.26]
MYMLKGGALPIPCWILVVRFLQFFSAVLILGLTAYPLSVYGGGPIQPALIATIIIAILTIIPILVLTTPLHLIQLKVYDPRVALAMDGFAALFWLGALAALASYQRIFRYYGREGHRRRDLDIKVMDMRRALRRELELRLIDIEFEECYKCRKAWRTGTAAAWFSVVEFFLFLFTTLMSLYYYHCHMTDIPVPGTGGHVTKKTGHSGVAAATAAGTTIATAAQEGEQHQMRSMPQQSASRGGAEAPSSAQYMNTPQP